MNQPLHDCEDCECTDICPGDEPKKGDDSMPFILPQKVYEVIRWVISIVFPAAIMLFAIIAGEFYIPHSESIIKIVAGVGTFLGTIFCVSKLSYDLKNKNNKEECDLDFGQNH